MWRYFSKTGNFQLGFHVIPIEYIFYQFVPVQLKSNLLEEKPPACFCLLLSHLHNRLHARGKLVIQERRLLRVHKNHLRIVLLHSLIFWSPSGLDRDVREALKLQAVPPSWHWLKPPRSQSFPRRPLLSASQYPPIMDGFNLGSFGDDSNQQRCSFGRGHVAKSHQETTFPKAIRQRNHRG